MPFSVLRSWAVADGAPRNQPAKPGCPALDCEVTSLTRTWRLPHWSRRVAWQVAWAGSGWFFSGSPSAWRSRLMVRAALTLKNTSSPPRPLADRTTCSLRSGTVVVDGSVEVGRDVGVVDEDVPSPPSPSPSHAAPRRRTVDRTMTAARRRRISVMTAHSSQWGRAGPDTLRPDGPVSHRRMDRRTRRRRPAGSRPGRGLRDDPADR